MKHGLSRHIIGLGILSLFLMSSCNTTRFLDPGEFLLTKNSVQIESEGKVVKKRELRYELESRFKQKPNRNFFFFFPRELFYFRNEKKTSKFSKWVRKSIGEKPAIFDQRLTERTRKSMVGLLQFKGYYNAQVSVEEKVKGSRQRKIELTYLVEPGKQFKVDSIFYFSQDQEVDTILQNLSEESKLSPGTGLDGSLYEEEKARIRRYMQNHGYAFFFPNAFAPLKADTTLAPKKANVFFEVLAPPEDTVHQKYWIGDIVIYPEFNPRTPEAQLLDTLIDGIRFRAPSEDFLVKPRVIIQKLFLKEGNLYRYDDINRTQQSLSSLSIFRFVRIRERIDTLEDNTINFTIELSSNRKQELGFDFDISYANRSGATITGNLIGLSVSPSYSHRNLFRGGELFTLNFLAGVEVQPGTGPFWNTVDIGTNAEIVFPKYINFLNLWSPFYKLRKALSKKGDIAREERTPFLYETMQERATTRVNLGYNYLSIINFYRYNLFNASLGYDVQIANNQRFIFDHVGIDFLTPQTDSAFDVILEQNPFLQRSFGPQLFTGFLFRNAGYSYSSRPNPTGESFVLSFVFELSGLEILTANYLSNAITGRKDTFRIGSVQFSQYLTVESGIRYYRQLSPTTTLAARLNIGVGRPYGLTSDVPYVKQFFVGGPNSIRAWPARGLGPGGYEDPLTRDPDNRLLFYQSGDFRIEFNLEYRFPLLWQLKGALFLDGGNVWTFDFDPDRCGSQFLFRGKVVSPCGEGGPQAVDPFYKQIALGTGIGLRLDLSFFVIRFDTGLRLRNPFPRNGDPETAVGLDYFVDWTEGLFTDYLNFNLALGYPF